MATTDPRTADGVDIKPRSRDVTDGLERTAARGMLRAVGLGDEDFAKPQIGVASSWNEITPCNLSLDRLAKAVKDGVHAGGGYPLEFGTISVSDGISMGHEGMHFSLVSREIIADSVETVMNAERLDGSVLLAGCDKSLPGMLMAAARLDLASVFLYAGTILPGIAKLSDGSERTVTIIDAFEAVGACAAGRMSREDVDAIERPGQGRPGVQEDRGHIESGGRHQHPGKGLVATGQQNAAVQLLRTEHGLHRVGDDLSADQRVVHAPVAHRDAVGDRDGAELEGVSVGLVHTLFGGLGQPIQREVAGGDLVPGTGDADLRLAPVVVAHPDGPQHAAGSGPLDAVGDDVTVRLAVLLRLVFGGGAGILTHGAELYDAHRRPADGAVPVGDRRRGRTARPDGTHP